MREQLQQRLEALKKEFNTGQARAVELEKQQATLHQTLLRISGAIQVLEEELKVAHPHDGAPLEDTTETDPARANGTYAPVA